MEITKIGPDYAGNDQFSVSLDGKALGTIRHIKPENIQHYSRHMRKSATWVIGGNRGGHYRTKADAAAYFTNTAFFPNVVTR